MTENIIDHKQLIAGLDDHTRVELTTRTNLAGLVMLVSRSLGIATTGYWIYSGLIGWQLALILHGIQLVFLFTLLHETVHDTPFASNALNRISSWFAALVVCLPPLWFRYFHLAHHRYTHDKEKDPELQGKQIQTRLDYIVSITGIPVWMFHARTLLANALGRTRYAYLPDGAKARVQTEACGMLLFYVVVAVASFSLESAAALWLWLFPLILGQPFLRLYLMAEHGRCPHVSNMLENTRTTYTSRIVRWLAWNMPYHAEHHAYPSVPFHKLPDFHKITQQHLRETEDGYRRYHAKTLRLLTDEKTE